MTSPDPYRALPNSFKRRLHAGETLIGCWCSLANPITTEVLGIAGFDWLLIDGEHSPNGLASILQQAQAIAAYPGVNAIARVPLGHGDAGAALIKQYLDLGLQTLLVPMVDTPEQARAIVRATSPMSAWRSTAASAGPHRQPPLRDRAG